MLRPEDTYREWEQLLFAHIELRTILFLERREIERERTHHLFGAFSAHRHFNGIPIRVTVVMRKCQSKVKFSISNKGWVTMGATLIVCTFYIEIVVGFSIDP